MVRKARYGRKKRGKVELRWRDIVEDDLREKTSSKQRRPHQVALGKGIVKKSMYTYDRNITPILSK